MIEQIKSINDALETENHLAALALALTLPDICGQIEYPKLGVGQRYKHWFHNWVEHFYADPQGWTNEETINSSGKAINPSLTAEMCYALRNAFLHSGNSDLGSKAKDFDFKLSLLGADYRGEMRGRNRKVLNRSIWIDVSRLCKNLSKAAEDYYEHKGKDAFKDKKITLIE